MIYLQNFGHFVSDSTFFRPSPWAWDQTNGVRWIDNDNGSHISWHWHCPEPWDKVSLKCQSYNSKHIWIWRRMNCIILKHTPKPRENWNEAKIRLKKENRRLIRFGTTHGQFGIIKKYQACQYLIIWQKRNETWKYWWKSFISFVMSRQNVKLTLVINNFRSINTHTRSRV